MGQKAGKKWTAEAVSQPTIPKPDRLLDTLRRELRHQGQPVDLMLREFDLGLGLLATLALGGLTFQRLTRPLHRLASHMQAYKLRDGAAAPDGTPAATHIQGDEITAIAGAFQGMTQLIEQQARREQQQGNAHREMMASVAHDLRTPLTALHGHLEALSAPRTAAVPDATEAAESGRHQQRVLNAALAKSNTVRRLSQLLFELAALQSDHPVLHRERFNLDELVTDAVQKFELGQQPPW